ncbi:phBC6A51 family helix-turn-helix protein [Cytobacillus sp. FSL R7-0680]|uniref:phBC6A51 family helix-turn-helix protein n=1 Tax=Cytobacillus sp. FSL R7-0680 TaxID=2921689 RepID=UPI0030F73F5B
MITLNEIKAHLTPEQMKVAQGIVENEFLGKKKLSYEDLAESLGISTRTLYNWRRDRYFTLYQSYLADHELDNFMPTAVAKLKESIEGRSSNGIPSMKALELYLKLTGRLVDKKEIVKSEEHTSRVRVTREDISKDLANLDKMLN